VLDSGRAGTLELVQVRAAQSRSMNRDAFISYASQDGATARAQCDLLEDSGIACWMAPRDVQPGRDFDEEIVVAPSSGPIFAS